ncbi:MAG TPA: Rieske 2Fe-2S domain-containing protein [Polyangiaceae bacterium]|nr:Rieske 2Fe-2S domain-containing protein [Polyangiaceae bacterium]
MEPSPPPGSSPRKLVVTLDGEAIGNEPSLVAGGAVIVCRDASGRIHAAPNRCRHQGGRFVRGKSCELVCPHHGWKLDGSTMTYTNPRGDLRQDELPVEIDGAGRVAVYDVTRSRPWEEARVMRRPLQEGEFTLQFYAHACIELVAAGYRLFTDPWLIGPAFSRGWWLSQRPPDDWPERLAAADGIFISHNHSDHLNRHTLAVVAKRRRDVPIYIPAFDSPAMATALAGLGFTDLRVVPFDRWETLRDDFRFMILPDATGRDDSGVLVEYAGHRVLDSVDAQNLRGGEIPTGIDVLLSSFAGGASGFPVCWSELYDEAKILDMVTKSRRRHALGAATMARDAAARMFVPFAGYFYEAHPADADIRRRNVKNSPEEMRELVRKLSPSTAVWIPDPGGVLDIGSLRVLKEGHATPPSPDVDAFTALIASDLYFAPLASTDGITQYFAWAGFRADLVLHVVETDETFATPLREFLYDFSMGALVEQRPTTAHRYLRMRVRADVFRHVLRNGQPWEEISIGFQARFYREPDAYNFDFWDHFQNHLPVTPPVWRPKSVRPAAIEPSDRVA